MATHSERLKELSIDLPAVTTPVGAYVPALRHGDLLFLSGQVPLLDGKVAYTGKVGDGRTLEDAIAAARICSLNAVAVAANAETPGDSVPLVTGNTKHFPEESRQGMSIASRRFFVDHYDESAHQ